LVEIEMLERKTSGLKKLTKDVNVCKKIIMMIIIAARIMRC